MKSLFRKVGTTVLISGACFSFALAQPVVSQAYNDHQGVYLSGNLGLGVGADRNDDTGHIDGGAYGFGANAFLGYQLNRYVAVELGATGVLGLLNTYTLDADVKGIVPLGDRFSLFGKAGGGLLTAQVCFLGSCDNHTEPGVFVGGGLGYAFTSHLTGTVGYDGVIPLAKHNDNNFTGIYGLISVGLTYHFS